MLPILFTSIGDTCLSICITIKEAVLLEKNEKYLSFIRGVSLYPQKSTDIINVPRGTGGIATFYRRAARVLVCASGI